MKNWLLKKKYRLLPFLICFYLCFFKTMLAPEETKETESVAASEAPQVPAMSFPQGPNFQVPDSSVTVLNLQRRRRGPGGSTVITQAPDVIDETKTGSSPGVVAGTALGAGVLGAAAGAGAALAAMTAKANAAQAALDQANDDLGKEKKRAEKAEKERDGRLEKKDSDAIIAARIQAAAERDQAVATLATREQALATLQAQAQQCHDENGKLTAEVERLTKENEVISVLQGQNAAFQAELAQLKHSSKPTQDPQSPSPSPQTPSPSAPTHRPDLPSGLPATHDQASDISTQDAQDLQSQANDELRKRYDALYTDNQQLLAIVQNLEIRNNELTQALSQQQGQNGQNSELVARLNDCLTENQLWQQKVKELSQQFQAIISQKDNQINQLTSENQQLKDAFSKANEQNGQFKDSILALQEENNQLKNTLQRYEAQYNLLQQKFDAALSERDAALNQVQQLQAQLSQLGSYSSDLAWARTEIDRLTQENAQLKRDYDGLHQAALAQINQITQEKDGLVLQLQQLQSRFDALQAENADYAVQIAKAQQDAADQKTLDDKTIQDQATEITKLKAEISRLEAQIAAIGDPTAKDAEIAQLKAVLQKATDELRNCQTSAADLQAQLEQVKALVERFKREKLDLESENKQLRDSLDQAKQELEAEKQKSRREMVDLRRQLADLQQQLDDCTTRNISLLAQIQRLTTQFSGPLPYGSSYGSSLYSTGLSGHPSSRRSNGSSQSLSAPISINLGYPPNLSGYPQSTQTHDQVDPSASIISASDSIITETRPNVPPPAPTSRPQTSDFSDQADFPEGNDHNVGGGAGSSHFTRPEESLTTSFVRPPAPAPLAKKKGALQSDVSRIAQGPSTADLLGLSPIQGETERFQKDASSASSLTTASDRPR